MKAGIVLVALSLLAIQANAHSYFAANATSDTLPVAAIATIFEHAGLAAWNVTLTGLSPGPVNISIVDGSPPNVATAAQAFVVTLWSGAAEGADLDASGDFDASDLEGAAAGMPIDELEGHMNMRHIFLAVAAPQGTAYGAWAEVGADEDAMDMGGEAAEGAAAAADDGHAGHAHRRMLTA